MARLLYGYTPGDFGVAEDATNSDALITAGLTLDIYDEPGGTQQTDLLDSAGDPATQATSSAGGVVIFQGPDGHDKDLYGTPDAGTTWYRFPPSPDSLVDRVAALEAATANDLDDLSDVNTSGVADGDVLTYVSATQTWVPEAPAATSTLGGLSDVDTTGIVDGDILQWDATGSEWVPVDPPAAGDYAATDHTHTYQLTGVVLEQGDPLPTSPALPDGALIFRLANVTFGYGVNVGTATGTFGTTATLTVGTSVAAGALLVVGVGWGAADVTFSVADSQSNTYTAATTRLYQSTTTGVQLFYSVLTTGLSSGDTITVTSSASTNHIAMVVSSVIGPNATPLDQAATNGQVNTTAPTVGPTSTLASSPQIAFAAIAYIPTDRTFTPDSGWTLAGSASTGTRAVYLIYKEVSDTTAVTGGGTITGTQVVTASALATFKAA